MTTNRKRKSWVLSKPPKEPKSRNTAENLAHDNPRGRRAWEIAYEARAAEFLVAGKPFSGAMMGLGDRILPGTRKKVFEVKTVLTYTRKKPTTIYSMSD